MPTKSGVKVFGAVLAFILLFLYAATVSMMISAVVRCEAENENADPAETAVPIDECIAGKVTGGMEYIVTTVAGLVSAVVVAQLAVTPPGQSPTTGLVPKPKAGEPDKHPWLRRLGSAVVWFYLGIWLATGLSSLVVGVMLYTDAYSTLSDLGTTWLGLAVSGTLAYLGIEPPPLTGGLDS